MKTTETAPKNKVQQNGEALKSGAEKTTSKVVEMSTSKIDEVLQPTAEGRIKKLDTFKILAEKHKFLVGKSDDLQKFIASSDGMKEKAVLKNSQGFEFEVSNSSVIEKVINVIEAELQTITKTSEKQVLEFTI